MVLQQRDNLITDVERVRAAILDTDQGGRERIRSLLANQDDFHIVVEGSGSAEALASIANEKPDIVFLDVQSLNGGGFEFLESMSRGCGESRPCVRPKPAQCVRLRSSHRPRR